MEKDCTNLNALYRILSGRIEIYGDSYTGDLSPYFFCFTKKKKQSSTYLFNSVLLAYGEGCIFRPNHGWITNAQLSKRSDILSFCPLCLFRSGIPGVSFTLFHLIPVPPSRSRKKEDTKAAALRPTPSRQPHTMEGNDDGVLSNGRFALEKDESLILTLDQDQEGDGEKKAETDADGIMDVLRDEIRGLQADKREVERQLDDARKDLHRAEAENHSLAAQAHHLEGELVRTQEDLAAAVCAAEDFEAEANRLKRAIKDLEADKAALEAKISALEGRLLAAAEESKEVRALQVKAEGLEMKVRDLTEELRLSKEQGKEAVEEQAKIGAAREEELEQVIKVLQETKTRLEGELAGLCRNIDRNLGERDDAVAAMENGLNVAWVAMAASVGAVAVGAAAVYLRKVGQR